MAQGVDFWRQVKAILFQYTGTEPFQLGMQLIKSLVSRYFLKTTVTHSSPAHHRIAGLVSKKTLESKQLRAQEIALTV